MHFELTVSICERKSRETNFSSRLRRLFGTGLLLGGFTYPEDYLNPESPSIQPQFVHDPETGVRAFPLRSGANFYCAPGYYQPPATHAILTVLKAGETVYYFVLCILVGCTRLKRKETHIF